MSGAWIVQKTRKVPLLLNVWLKVPFFFVPEPHLPFASETLWRCLPFQVQITFVPLLIVTGRGLNLSSLTETCCGLGFVGPADGSPPPPAAAATTAMVGTSFLI